MRIRLFSIIAFSCLADISIAQHTSAKQYTAPLAGQVVLSELSDKYSAHVYSMEMPEPDGKAEQQRMREIKQQIQKNAPRHRSVAQKTASTVMQPVVSINFVADSSSEIPPDNYTAVSKNNKGMTVMNDLVSVHDATTGNYLTRTSLYQLSIAVGLNNTFTTDNNYRYDPKVVYDPVADRFICVMLNGTDQYNFHAVIGFSKSNDPDSGWYFYKIYGDYRGDTTWFDYPSIAITQNELFVTGNKVKYDSRLAGRLHTLRNIPGAEERWL